MEVLVPAPVRGLGIGSTYALLAVSIVVIYRATEVVNFALPALMILGAYFTSLFVTGIGLPFPVGVVASTNERFARVEQMRKFRMIPKELDHEDGELTATQKVKRSSLNDMFGHLIADMYGNSAEYAGGDLVDVHPSRDFVPTHEQEG